MSALSSAVQAGIIYQLQQPTVQAGQTIELQGVVFNDTGSALTFVPPVTLQASLGNVDESARSLQFSLASPPDAIILPANTFARIAWTATAPQDTTGLQRLRIQGETASSLALQVSNDASASAGGQPPPPAWAAATPLLPQPGGSNPMPTQAKAVGSLAPSASPFDNFRNAISPYEPIYFVAGNRDGADGRFQISFKYRLLSPEDPARAGFMDHWYLGYTQTSLWDLHSDSIPFVDTTYNPSLFWSRDILWESPGRQASIGLNAGAEHRSNGKSDDDSRSLNDLYVEPSFNIRFEGGSTLKFMPRFKYYVATDRDMHYPDYLGRVDWKLRWAQDNGLVLTGLYRQGSEGRSASQIEAAWPLRRTFLPMNGYLYAQYFHGYGETLLGYRQKAGSVVRIGIALVP